MDGGTVSSIDDSQRRLKQDDLRWVELSCFSDLRGVRDRDGDNHLSLLVVSVETKPLNSRRLRHSGLEASTKDDIKRIIPY